ncbi:MAG: UMP kinase [Bacteroidales bacterium]
MKYKRILLKLSGESLTGKEQYGIDPEKLDYYAREIKSIVEEGVQVGIVMGGGNIYRGLKGMNEGMDRIQGDYMGMLATVINSVALQTALEKYGIRTKHLSALTIEPVTERMGSLKAIAYLEAGHVVLISGGTGNPFFTTDSAAALRAVEIKADAILKGTRVDGVYTADPEKDTSAVKFDQLTFQEAYERKLNIMDLTAFTLCSENHLPIVVFNINTPNNLHRIISGEKAGTLVTDQKKR